MEYLLIPNLLSADQCNELITNARMVSDMPGDMSWRDEQNYPEVRSSRLRWLRRGPSFSDAFSVIDAALDRGDQAFGFKTSHNPIDAIQFTEYHDARLGHYDWHHDDFEKPFDRMLSICIQLSEPDEYEGGALQLRVNNPPLPEVLCQRGTAIVFPSTTTHRVTQTTRGTRYSAVAWRYGQRPMAEIERSVIIPNFSNYQAMRSAYDNFFSNPDQHSAQHQIWDFWYVPQIYCYLRTNADRVLGSSLVQTFVDDLHKVIQERFGLRTVTWPFISTYVNGCHQEVHNDAMNGTYGYVLSLTHWDRRKFSGGETLLGKMDVFDKLEPREPRGRGNYFEEFPPHFGQLLLFDDRYPHAVPQIQGTMDPLQARVVLHGHCQR